MKFDTKLYKPVCGLYILDGETIYDLIGGRGTISSAYPNIFSTHLGSNLLYFHTSLTILMRLESLGLPDNTKEINNENLSQT